MTTTYSWQVTANTGLGTSGLSELRAFTTTGFIPFPHEGITAGYPFNESVYDYCEYNRINGVQIAGIARDAVPTTDRFGNANMAYWFNGSTAYLTFSGITQYYTTDDVLVDSEFKLPIGNQPRAFSVWFKTERLTNEASVDVWLGFTESNRQFGFALKSGLPQFTGMDEVLTGSGEWDDGRWHNVVINYDGNEVSLFMDGALNASRAVSLNTAKSVVVIGQSLPGTPNPTNFFGAIDDIATYERVLTFDEIQLIASQR